ncbi:MAG: glyoxylase-like metal-dependent hydrolase (beta-lactamase superfamily II) [Myxococcota bacterium]|jgi:sulfur dioxygenase
MFRQLFDATSSTYTYLLADSETGRAVLVDPVLEQVDRDLRILEEMGLTLAWVLETHVHADHVTAAATLREATGCKVAYPSSGMVEGADRLLAHGDRVQVDAVELEVRHTPGHTSGSACYVDHSGKRVFTGDTLLIRGCGRTDFQGGSARALYASVHAQLFTLHDDTLIYPGHDYNGRTASSIGEEKAHNTRLGAGKTEAEFVSIMDNLGLPYPRLMDIAVPANLRLGRKADPWTALKRAASGATQAPIDWVARNASLVRLVDVREPDEYNGPLGHVPDAALVPLSTLSEVSASWNKAEPVVLICRSGARSDRGALTMESLGFKAVASMTGGTVGWNQRSTPATRG